MFVCVSIESLVIVVDIEEIIHPISLATGAPPYNALGASCDRTVHKGVGLVSKIE